jgi:hypothetical protein
LISSRTKNGEVPLALTGEKDGHRVVCLAFDLEKGTLTDSDNLTLLLLFLNTIRWLLPHDPSAPLQMETGEAFFVPPGATPDSLRLTPPEGTPQLVETSAIEIDHVGEYRLNGSRYRAVLYANFFDEVESNIGRTEGDIPVAARQKAAIPPVQELHHTIPVEFGRLLYYGAAVLLLVEWLYALWRYHRMGAA